MSHPVFFLLGGARSYAPLFFGFLFLAALGWFLLDFTARRGLWRRGKAEKRTLSFSDIVKNSVNFIFALNIPGIRFGYFFSHLLFTIGLVLCSMCLFFNLINFVFVLLFHFALVQGAFYLILAALQDLAGIFVLSGVCVQLYIRLFSRSQNITTGVKDLLFFLALLLLLFAGYITEGIRIALSGFPPFERFAFISYIFAGVVSFFPQRLLELFYPAAYAVRFLLFLIIFINLANPRSVVRIFPYLNMVLWNRQKNDPQTKNALVEKSELDFEREDRFGVGELYDFSWKNLLDLDSCLKCGRCNEECPAVLASRKLYPKSIVQKLHAALDDYSKDADSDKPPLLVPEYISEEEIWDCYNCGSCKEFCPARIDHLSFFQGIRNYLCMEKSAVPDHLITLFRNVERSGNLMGKGRQERSRWLGDQSAISKVSVDTSYDYLLFVGCKYALDTAYRASLLNAVRIFEKAGLKIGVLADEEGCCGDVAMRAGNLPLFYKCAKSNIEKFLLYNVKNIICLCPHGYNLIKKEYPRVMAHMYNGTLEWDIAVFHYTEILDTLIGEGKLQLKKGISKNVVYHDPCFLGRYNEMYVGPRQVIASVPGIQLLEMTRSNETAVCCGASGGINASKRSLAYELGEFRAMDGYSAGAQYVITACPYCHESIKEGMRDIQQESVSVISLEDLIAESIE